jgi:hypothetical protein
MKLEIDEEERKTLKWSLWFAKSHLTEVISRDFKRSKEMPKGRNGFLDFARENMRARKVIINLLKKLKKLYKI